jgi:hypothetical protein
MPNRSSKPKRPRDPNQLAATIVGIATGEIPPDPPLDELKSAAALLGRLGGRKGGPARAAKLSPKRRTAIARKAAQARWERAAKKGEN